jgi:acyl-CoA synthetase (AMP-forming)/AMP-acid ligase II
MSPTPATGPRIVRSPLPNVDIPDTSVTDYTFRAAPDAAERVAIIDGVDGTAWTRGAVLDHVRRLAGGLHRRGISTGSTVALIAGNSPHFPIVFHAVTPTGATVTLTGATVTPINPTYGADEIAHQLDDAGVDLLIVGALAADTARAASGGRPVAVIGDVAKPQTLPSAISTSREAGGMKW